MWPVMLTTSPIATQSWTNVAPVRYRNGQNLYQRMIEPVASMRTIAPPVKAAFSF
jgi:hypothetical protein